jgi:hypothetical protein
VEHVLRLHFCSFDPKFLTNAEAMLFKLYLFHKGGIHVVDHVLRNTNGKILRRLLAEQFQQEAAKSEAEIEEDILKVHKHEIFLNFFFT